MKKIIVFALALFVAAWGLTARAAGCSSVEQTGDHDWRSTGNGRKATCMTRGTDEQQCAACGQVRTVEQDYGDHNWAKGERKPATCISTGYATEKCTVCGQQRWVDLPRSGHSYGAWVVTQEAEPNAQGVRYHVCTVCGAQQTGKFYPDGTTYRGCPDGEDVAAMQEMLIDLGYLSGKADGAFGPKTEAAVTEFQRANGLNVDGVAWPQTVDLLTGLWRVSMDIAAAPQTQAYSDYCVPWAEGGVEYVSCCGEHGPILDWEAAIMARGATAQEVETIAENWGRGVDILYGQWAGDYQGEPQIQEAIVAAQKAFMESLALREAAMGGGEEALMWRVGALRAECLRLCRLLNLVGD